MKKKWCTLSFHDGRPSDVVVQVRNIEMEATLFSAFTNHLNIEAADVCVALLNRFGFGGSGPLLFCSSLLFSVCAFVFLSVCLSVCLFVCLSVCLSAHRLAQGKFCSAIGFAVHGGGLDRYDL